MTREKLLDLTHSASVHQASENLLTDVEYEWLSVISTCGREGHILFPVLNTPTDGILSKSNPAEENPLGRSE